MRPQKFAKPLFISHKYPTIPFPFPSISAPSQALQWEAPHRLRLMGFFPSLLKYEGEVVVRISVVGLLNKGSVTVEASRQPLWQSALFISNQINYIAEEPTYRGRFCHVPRHECARMYKAHVEAGPTPPASPSPVVVLGPTSTLAFGFPMTIFIAKAASLESQPSFSSSRWTIATKLPK
jgi:hypothetical protein